MSKELLKSVGCSTPSRTQIETRPAATNEKVYFVFLFNRKKIWYLKILIIYKNIFIKNECIFKGSGA